MDIVFIGAMLLFIAMTWAMAAGCEQLGGRP
jgi:hypothetical protein